MSPLTESTFVSHRSHLASWNILGIANHSTFSSEVGSVSTISTARLLDLQYELVQDQRTNTFKSIGSNSLPLDQPGQVSFSHSDHSHHRPQPSPLLKCTWPPILSSYMQAEIKYPLGVSLNLHKSRNQASYMWDLVSKVRISLTYKKLDRRYNR